MGKDKKEKRKSVAEEEDAGENKEERWDELVSQVGPIANPLASRKLTKKLFKVVKKAQKQKQLRKGIREVQKFVRKGETGLLVFAGNTSPIDVICHMPMVCEEKELPYCYVPSKEDLGLASGSKRPTCMLMIKPHEDYQELYDQCYDEVQGLPLPV